MDDTVRKQLWNKYYTKLTKAVDIGYKPQSQFYDTDLVSALKHNMALFSAFKNVSFENVLGDMLKAGKLPTFNEFRSEALKVAHLYNVNWLRTEYDQTIATARMAQKWQDFQRNKEVYPNLRYVAILDERVRDKHRGWHGTVAPLDHPLWEKMLPPNDWGCRCSVVQTDEPVSKHIPEVKIKKQFQNNAAVSGKIFPEIVYANGLTDKMIRKTTDDALKWIKGK